MQSDTQEVRKTYGGQDEINLAEKIGRAHV